MASTGIADRVAIIGMGCTQFGERWDSGVEDLLIESHQHALTSAGLAAADIDAYWLGTLGSGYSGMTLARALRTENKPVTRVENYCATGSEALRNAFRHAKASQIEMEIRYDEQHLRLRIRDDGKGIDPRLVDGNRSPGHWGLHGMRERAKLMGAAVEVWSELDSGT